MTKKTTTKKKGLDLPQAIVVAVVGAALVVTAGMIVVWGPEHASTQIMEWIALGVAGLGVLFAALRSKGLFTPTSSDDGDAS